jgi:hypothetical protein
MSAEATDERVKCRCGLTMLVSTRGARYCENCDTVQPHEPYGYERRKTREDIRFDMSWLQTINREYTDNTHKEVGTANTEGGEESSSTENEGETNGTD